MKVLIEGEVIEQHEGKMYVVKLDDGYAGAKVTVAVEKTIGMVQSPDGMMIEERVRQLYLNDPLSCTIAKTLAAHAGKDCSDYFILSALGHPELLNILESCQRRQKNKIDEMMRRPHNPIIGD